MGVKKVLMKNVADLIMPEAIDIGVKIGTEIYEQQKAMIKIPDLKDVYVEEAIRILKDELNLIPTVAVANPNIAFADESVNEVMYSEPRFGTRVNPGTAIKVYYLTQEVIEKSKELLGSFIHEFKVPIVVGLNIYDARDDLEGLGLRITQKLEQPSAAFINKEDGQVTRLSYPNGQKIGTKLKTGDRIWIYYVNDEVIHESKLLVSKKEQDKQEMIGKIGKISQDVSKGISDGAVNATKSFSQNIGNKFSKKK
jgi:hypothetical protein